MIVSHLAFGVSSCIFRLQKSNSCRPFDISVALTHQHAARFAHEVGHYLSTLDDSVRVGASTFLTLVPRINQVSPKSTSYLAKINNKNGNTAEKTLTGGGGAEGENKKRYNSKQERERERDGQKHLFC